MYFTGILSTCDFSSHERTNSLHVHATYISFPPVHCYGRPEKLGGLGKEELEK